MEFQQLRYFLEICKFRSFARAAENCFVSPQGISMSMQRLEAELQCKLFAWRGKDLLLTKHAKFLLPIAEKILDNVDVYERYFHVGKHLDQNVKLVLSRGAFEEFAEAPIQKFKELYPNIYLDFRRESDVGAEMSVKSEVSELAFCPGPIDCAAFDSQLVCQSRFAVYVHQAHPLADHKAITAKCLQGFPLTVMNEQTKALSLLLDAAKAAGVELWINNQTDSTKTLFELACVEGQVGVATMALQPIAALSKRKLKAIPFQEESLEWRLYLIKKKGAALSTNAKLLYDVLVTHMEKVKKC